MAPKQDDPIAKAWAPYIDKANMSGQDDLRKLYIKLRQAGIDPKQAEHMPGVDLGGGYTYNPFHSSLTFDSNPDEQGADYSYNAGQNTTRYNGNTYQGYYDVNVLGQMTNEDLKAAQEGQAGWLAEVERSNEAWAEGEYIKDLKKIGGMGTDSYRVDDDAFVNRIGWDKTQQDTAKGYQERILSDAYVAAYNRMNPDKQITSRSEIQDKGIFQDIVGQDWSSNYITTKDQLQQSNVEGIEAIHNNPNLSPEVKKAILQQANSQYGVDSSPLLEAYKEGQSQLAPKTIGLEQYSAERDKLLESGASPEAIESLRTNYEKSQTQHQNFPSNPEATGTKSNSPEGLDWKSLYDDLSGFIKDLKSNPAQAIQPQKREQLVNYYDYGSNAASRQATPQKYSFGSTSYSGKGA